jgi:hypothetical protein
MNKQKALEEVKNVGGYFYDFLDTHSVDEIIGWIKRDVSKSSKLKGIPLWELTRDAFYQVLEIMSDEELDSILEEEYAISPDQVNGSREFFKRIAHEIVETAQIVKPKLTE